MSRSRQRGMLACAVLAVAGLAAEVRAATSGDGSAAHR